MGFFSSSAKTSSFNPDLDLYTRAYRGFSPWSFATLDPSAALASMGEGTKLSDLRTVAEGGARGTGIDLGPEFKKKLQEQVAFEGEQLSAEQDALRRIVDRQKSGKFLTPQETDFINTSLDKAFEYTQTVGMKNLQRFADTLSGSRGLRMSDTPVAQPAMEAARDLQLGIGSKRAELGLSTTLGFSQQQQAFDESFRQSLAGLRMGAWQTRMGHLFGGGVQGAANISSMSEQKATPSTLSNIQQSMAATTQAIDLAGKIGGGFSGFSSKPTP